MPDRPGGLLHRALHAVHRESRLRCERDLCAERASRVLFLCEPISAAQALDWGLVNRVVPFERLDAAVREMADKLLEKFPGCLRYTQCQVNYWKDQAWYATIGHAREWLALHFAHPETAEGMRAFVEKRPADYKRIRSRKVRSSDHRSRT